MNKTVLFNVSDYSKTMKVRNFARKNQRISRDFGSNIGKIIDSGKDQLKCSNLHLIFSSIKFDKRICFKGR
jgi:hypothetical protein